MYEHPTWASAYAGCLNIGQFFRKKSAERVAKHGSFLYNCLNSTGGCIMDGIVFSNLNEIVKNPSALADPMRDGCWGMIPYEITDFTGTCLVSREGDSPEDLILQPKLTGWYKIFIASWKIVDGYSFLMKLDNEKHFKLVNDSIYPPVGPTPRMEYVEEFFWRCADLTDREILIKKVRREEDISPLVWLRCVPMTDAEIAAYKEYINPEGHRNMHLHFDCDTNVIFGVNSVEDSLIKLYSVENTDAKFVTHEVNECLYDYSTRETTARRLRAFTNRYADENEKAAAMMQEITRARVDLLHEFGVLAYAGIRMTLGQNGYPTDSGARNIFMDTHPEACIVTRDGGHMAAASYAFKETQDYVIEYFKRFIGYGYDGVSLIFHRGLFIGYEQPVLDAFARRYDGLDARRVPMDDARIKDVWGSILADFVRRLHEELDAFAGRHVPINVITCCTPEISRRVGVDVEMMAKLGAIDHICSDSMETYERLGGMLDEDGLINLDEYKRILRIQSVFGRRCGENWELTKEGSVQFQSIADTYGIDYFAPLSPNYKTCAEEYIDWVNNLKKLGVKNISFFNFCHSSQDMPVYHSTTKFGHDAVNTEYCRIVSYRLLSFDGIDISTFRPH